MPGDTAWAPDGRAETKALEAEIKTLGEQVAILAQRVADLELTRRRPAPRDADDLAVVRALAGAVARTACVVAEGRSVPLRAVRFTSRDVRNLARIDQDLRHALAQADADGTRSLGRLLARVQGHAIAGWTVELVTCSRVCVWRLVPSASSVSETEPPGVA